MYYLSQCLIAQIHSFKAALLVQKKIYTDAAYHLEQAVKHQNNNANLYLDLGDAYYFSANLNPTSRYAIPLLEAAKQAYEKGIRLNPLDSGNAFSMARNEFLLSWSYQQQYPDNKNIPYDPMPYFDRAINLRPNDIRIYYLMAAHYHHQHDKENLKHIVRKAAYVFPQSYAMLIKDIYWAEDLRPACKAGLEDALKSVTSGATQYYSPENIHYTLSAILTEDQDWAGALFHYQQALTYEQYNINSYHYARQGYLHLKNQAFDEAEKFFFKTLHNSLNRDGDLKTICHWYWAEKRLDEFVKFYQNVDRTILLSASGRITIAQNFIRFKQYEQAKEIVTTIASQSSEPEAYHILAQIAEAQKDWDAMELASQKAAFLDPDNSQYHYIFSRSLRNQNKLGRAEEAADMAIKYQQKSYPWYYHYRGSIRWQKADYQGALDDWTQAISLKSDYPGFYAHAAEACAKLEKWDDVIKYYSKALELDPENAAYKKRYNEFIQKNAHQVSPQTFFTVKIIFGV
jgi:tetratricopeptide (TPR) repeat protein